MALNLASFYRPLLALVLAALLPIASADFMHTLVCRRLIVPDDTSNSAEKPFCLPVVPSSMVSLGTRHVSLFFVSLCVRAYNAVLTRC